MLYKRLAVFACAVLIALCAARAGRAREEGGEMAVQTRGRVRAPELAGGRGWLNTDKPLSLSALRGKVVLLDFWTYGCVNCIHVIPDLKKLEAKYAKELVVIGVHSAKFENEKETENIRRIVLRYEIEHPVVNDADFAIWGAYAVKAWPTLVLIDPAGYVVGQVSGEGNYEELDRAIGETVAAARKRGELNEQPLKLALERAKTADLPLAFPGKVLADEQTGRLFVADSNHNRVVVARLDGTVLEVVGTGARGATDGAFEVATFHRPQGLALERGREGKDDLLYVADTENHLIRRVDLRARTVSTVAGTGRQAQTYLSGEDGDAPARTTPLNSPWDLLVVGRRLYIAMAGPHQIWRLHLNTDRISVFAGSGREARADGPRQQAAFAQPSGLATDGRTLYVADSESNVVRAVDLSTPRAAGGEEPVAETDAEDNPVEVRPRGEVSPPGEDETKPGGAVTSSAPSAPEQVRTLAGGDLFEFGDEDGAGDSVRLQHPLGVAYVEGRGVFVADTYNHKIKLLDADTRSVRTFAGTGHPGQSDGEKPSFYEPGGLSYAAGKLYIADTNNHAVRVVDARTGAASTLALKGLRPPTSSTVAVADDAATGAEEIKLTRQRLLTGAPSALVLDVMLPAGYHLNEAAPQRVRVSVEGGSRLLALEGATPAAFTRAGRDVRLPLRVPFKALAPGAAELRARVTLYYCREDNTGTCRIKTLAWRIPVEVAANAGAPREIKLLWKIE
jgi:thiol-disulfide isomerase/thioredoxin